VATHLESHCILEFKGYEGSIAFDIDFYTCQIVCGCLEAKRLSHPGLMDLGVVDDLENIQHYLTYIVFLTLGYMDYEDVLVISFT